MLDLDGKVAERYAPAGVQPDLPRDQVPIASNLIIDQQGKIQFFSLLDSANFDAKLVQVTARLEELLSTAKRPTEVVSVIPPLLVTLSPGGKAQVRFAILIANGFHIQANPASDPYLVPTKLELLGARGVYTEVPKYPLGERYRLEGASQDLLAYDGTVELLVPLRAAQDAMPGDWILRGKLRYQACDARRCLPPSSLDVSVPVHVTATKRKILLLQ